MSDGLETHTVQNLHCDNPILEFIKAKTFQELSNPIKALCITSTTLAEALFSLFRWLLTSHSLSFQTLIFLYPFAHLLFISITSRTFCLASNASRFSLTSPNLYSLVPFSVSVSASSKPLSTSFRNSFLYFFKQASLSHFLCSNSFHPRSRSFSRFKRYFFILLSASANIHF